VHVKLRSPGCTHENRLSSVASGAVDRGGNRLGGWGPGRGRAPIGANLPHGALRSGLAIGEVQALLNPHVDSGERGVSPGSPGQWTVVGIAPGGGDRGGGSRPLPAQGGGTRRSFLVAPTPPALRAPPPPLPGAGAVCGDTRGKPCLGHGNLPERTGRALTDCPPDKDHDCFPRRWRAIDRRLTSNTQNRPSSPESSVILMNLHTES